jgi:ribose transport system substrate-binding protein
VAVDTKCAAVASDQLLQLNFCDQKRSGMKMKRILVPAFTGAFAVALSLTPAMAQSKKQLALVTNAAADFWTIAKRGVEKAQKEHPDYSMEVVITGQATAAEQRRELDDLLARGVAGVSISAIDPKNSTAEFNKVAAKAALFTTDSDAPQSNRAVYIGTDNVAAGRQAGEEIKKALPNGGKVMMFVGTMDADNARERVQGIKDVLLGSKIQIADIRTDGVDFAKAKSNVQDALAKGGVDCLVGLYSYNTPQIYSAVKEAGKAGTVRVVGFDEDPQTLRGIADGTIQSTIVQQPFEFGYQSMSDLIKYINGDKSFIPQNKLIIIPTRVIEKSNVAQFQDSMKQLLAK